MVQTRREDRWPLYLPGPRDDILALGVVSLGYGQLENMFRSVFSLVTSMNEHQVAAIFERMPNNHRLSAITQMMSKTILPDKIKDRVSHFCNGFHIWGKQARSNAFPLRRRVYQR